MGTANKAINAPVSFLFSKNEVREAIKKIAESCSDTSLLTAMIEASGAAEASQSVIKWPNISPHAAIQRFSMGDFTCLRRAKKIPTSTAKTRMVGSLSSKVAIGFFPGRTGNVAYTRPALTPATW